MGRYCWLWAVIAGYGPRWRSAPRPIYM